MQDILFKFKIKVTALYEEIVVTKKYTVIQILKGLSIHRMKDN